ncbi:sesquiterpene synthase 15a-like isoform X1 [Solanum stenotomum]|uniref:sesquiterpene synthase 15a-like isoform X1 n=1 Tax=Solanum stenotomum TaxID=172797 RepID=UPI0020D007E9|nr:sesquiterpene synthase 15a-like isoform X1 [Solanum stenotomum]XP_049414337.1 sesquiterpene synthase 15a-like isoform X1 [Solanum stenotomum]XP_049414339.1 sesquiterpene synthase 15a-like isoform X1 [Solanum stenotomum]
MLVISPSKSLQKLGLINTIQLLGLAYHFEHEIEESLSEIYNGYEEWIGEFGESHDLHVVALSFRLLRQQGYYVSSDVFRKFIDDQENYNKALVNDMQGLLSLYEAAQFRVHDEEILDEAINFTTTHLKLLLPKLSNSLSMQVSYALKYPINKTIARVATRKYISFYQEDKSCDQVILTFAKLDFNTLQKMHKRELCDITRWWKELDVANEVPFARDRVVELYFWSLGVYFEPQYNVARNILTKVLCFTSITDDIYDIYGTLHELTLLTNAIERWNIDAAEKLAPYMKLVYTALLDFYNEVEKELAKENKSFRVNFAISEMKKLVRAYFQEAKWYHGNTVPRMEEYMMNGIQTSTVPYLSTACWLGMGDEATKEAFEWITTEPPILVASSIIARLLNDIVSHEREIERGDVASGIDCYINDYDATKEDAYMEIRKIIENNWKDLNQQCLKPITVSSVLLMPVLNLGRVSEFFYKDEDAYTFSKNNLKDVIFMVLVDPIKV